MELYTMPQLKGSPAYSEHVPFIEGSGDVSNQSLSRADVTKYGTDILSSSAWSAVIHHPAEDSEPDELPSTVDMDAIKEPPTPLPAPCTPGGGTCFDSSASKNEQSEEEDDDSGSGSDSDGDSDSETGNESNTESEDGSRSSNCSWSDSDSDSPSSGEDHGDTGARRAVHRSTSSSSRSSQQSDSSSTPQHFSIRETNFDQGGLKLKISALKMPKPKTSVRNKSASSTDNERDDTSSDEKEVIEKPSKVFKHKDTSSKDLEKEKNNIKVEDKVAESFSHKAIEKKEMSDVKDRHESNKIVESNACEIGMKIKSDIKSSVKEHINVNSTNLRSRLKTSSNNTENKSKVSSKPVEVNSSKENQRTSQRHSAKETNIKTPTNETKSAKSSPVKSNSNTNASNKQNKLALSNSSASLSSTPTKQSGINNSAPSGPNLGRLRSFHKKDLPETKSPSKAAFGGGNGGGGQDRRRNSDASDSSSEEEGDDEDEKHGDGSGDEITQLAHQLAQPPESDASIPISEHLQVINQEDLAAILPDVVGVGGGPFDGFEDVSSGEGCRAAGAPGSARTSTRAGPVGPGAESSSDMELLPDVSDVINRINLDSDAGQEDEQNNHSANSADDTENDEVGYSSNLLQQFNQKTEQLSVRNGSSSSRSKMGNDASRGSGSDAPRRKRGRPPKLSVAPPVLHQNNKLVMPPELEAYCSVSNVSPDSGIQSVAGSPSHQSCSPASNPPAHSPAPPVLSKLHPPSPPPSINRVHTKKVPVPFSSRKKNSAPGSNGQQHHHSRNKEPITTNTKLTKLYTTTEELRVGNGGKRGPGRPKGSGRKKGRPPRKEEIAIPRLPADMLKVPPFYKVKTTVVNMVEHEDLPRLHGMMVPGKRGPGRPKKMPPTLEPNFPLGDRSSIPSGSSGNKGKRTGDCINSNLSIGSSKSISDIHQKSISSNFYINGDKRMDSVSSKNPKTWNESCSKNGEMRNHVSRKDSSKSYQKVFGGFDKRNNRRQLIRSRTVLPRGFARVRLHKHKKRKKRLKSNVFRVDPNFLTNLEKLVEEFKKSCRITTLDESPSSKISVHECPPVLPSIFRVKRIVKKRKGSEKAKVSDKESGTEPEAVKEKTHTPTQTCTPAPSQPSNVVKRRPKKNAVEAPKSRDKDKSEATNNEQRLPLKKRHYHISSSTSTTFQNDSEGSPKSDSMSSDSNKSATKTSVATIVSEKTIEKFQLTSSGSSAKSCNTPKSNIIIASGSKSTNVTKTEVKSKMEIHRNSIDEAIEACITKYSADESRSVIFTPKKRHRLEMERKDKSPGGCSRNLSGSKPETNSSIFQPNKRAGSRSSSTTNQALQGPASPAHGSVVSVGKRSNSRSNGSVSSVATSVITSVAGNTVSNQTKRTSSRSASVITANVDGPAVGQSSANKLVVQNTPSSKRSHSRNVSETTVTLVQSNDQPQKRSSRVLPSPSAGETLSNSFINNSVGTQKRAVTRSMDIDSLGASSVPSKAKPLPSSPQQPVPVVSVAPLSVLSSSSGNEFNIVGSVAVNCAAQNTRAASKSSGNFTPLSASSTEVYPKSPRAKVTQKPPAGVFEPTSKPDTDIDVVDLPSVLNKITERLNQFKNRSFENTLSTLESSKGNVTSVISTSIIDSSSNLNLSSVMTSAPVTSIKATTIVALTPPFSSNAATTCVTVTTTSSICTVVSSLTTVTSSSESCVTSKQLGQIDLRSTRPKRVNEDKVEDERKGKKRKVIKDIRVHVMKLSPSDIILKKAMVTVKHKIRRRKAINRTGFPVKKKKKKKPLVDAIQMNQGTTTCTSPPPVLEDQTKIEPTVVCSPLHDITPALTPIGNAKEETFVKEESSKVDKEALFLKSSDSRDGKERLIRTSNRRLLQLRVRAEASKRRKRKRNGMLPRESSSDPACSISTLPNKRLRKMKEDEEDDSDADSTKSRKKPPPRWRKKYLVAGLFSDFYKEDEPRKPSIDVGKSRIVYRPEEHKYGLLPPPHYCSKWVRQRRVNFQLPHDLWWLHVNSQLPGRDVVPSWNYKKIRTNVYYDVKPPNMFETQACNCAQSDCSNNNGGGCCLAGCGEDCINRLIYTECSPQLCPCKDKCSNQRIQRHEWAPGLTKFMTKDKGWGVKTKYAIKNGEFILEYVGEVVSEREFKNRMASRYQNDTHHYCLNLDGGLVIDGHRMGGDGRFVNHSCEPNCEMQKWCVNGLFRMALFALRDIEPHEELTYDYNFSLFNPAEGQPCKCGSSHCRGVIGGKYQRVQINGKENTKVTPIGNDQHSAINSNKSRKNARKGMAGKKPAKSLKEGKEVVKANKEPVKDVAIITNNNSNSNNHNNNNGLASVAMRLSHLLPLKPMTLQQQEFIRANHIFLLRNFEKVKQLRERLKQVVRGNTGNSSTETSVPPVVPDPQPGVFLSQLNALSTPRNIRTRRLAQAQENPEMTKTARLAYIFRHLFNAVAQAKEDNGELLAASFISMPSKRKVPQYYQRISEPIDLNTIEHTIVTGVYKTVESFDNDMNRLFANSVKFYGRTTDLGISATRLRKIYNVAKLDFVSQLEEILGESPPASFVPEQEDPGGEEEDVIRCVCGLYKDEGLMIQCERCLVWQHCDCVKADTNAEHYLCERCNPRPVDLEIPLESNPDYATEGQTHYMTLLRGDLQLRQGDTVYVLRDIPNEETGTDTTPPSKHNYKTVKVINYNDCDIFKIERLWKDEKGDRFAFGHHYLRPHETYHEPTRKFFHNEVMRVPLYEVVPIELIMGHCYVLDLNTFCKGRPVGADPQHIYICEYRVDKFARLFARLARPKVPPVCVKSYAFEKFDTRLKISRTYTPHGVINTKPSTSAVSRGRGGRTSTAHDHEEPLSGAASSSTTGVASTSHTLPSSVEDDEMPLARRSQQKQRLNCILLRLLSRLPTKQPLDLSFLLEPGRRHRKRPAMLSP